MELFLLQILDFKNVFVCVCVLVYLQEILQWHMADLLKTRPSPRVTMPNLVVLR